MHLTQPEICIATDDAGVDGCESIPARHLDFFGAAGPMDKAQVESGA